NPSSDHEHLRKGIEALTARDVEQARTARESLKKHSLDRQILTWAIALSNHPDVSSAEIAAAMCDLREWPGLGRLEAARERALYREAPPPEQVIDAFATVKPQTFEGIVLLARAHLASDDLDAARALMTPYWRTERLTESQEDLVIREFGSLFSADDHRFRAERMLYADRLRSAEQTG